MIAPETLVPPPVAPRRLHPVDRRAATPVTAGLCPQGRLCGCCPQDHRRKDKNGRAIGCREPHPPTDRHCRLPVPRDIPPCPERDTLAQPPVPGRCCVECGRVTARVAAGGMPWCAGTLPPDREESPDV